MPSTETSGCPSNTVHPPGTFPRRSAAWMPVKRRRRVPGVDLLQPLAHPAVRRRPPHAEERAEVPRHHRITAAPDLPIELQQRRHPGGEHREARHQAVGKADATRVDRVGDAVEACADRPQHAGHRQMLSQGNPWTFSCPAFACLSAGWPIRCGKSTKKNSRRPRNRLIMKEKNFWRELLRGRHQFRQ